MFDINNLMKQAQGLQKKMEEMQAELEKKEFEGAAAGGMVKITINGKFDRITSYNVCYTKLLRECSRPHSVVRR